jgi:hypothetical protein
MKSPTEVFELLLAKPVAVAGRIAGVVRRSITFDGQDELARLRWVRSREVNPKLGAANLRHDLYSFGAEGVIYISLEVIHGLVGQLSMGEKCTT